MEKPIAVFLQASAAFMLYAAGDFGGDAVLLIAPAIVSAAAGLWLWARPPRPSLPAGADARLAAAQLGQVHDALVTLQDDVAQLRDDRAFIRELYAERKTVSQP